jgi:hypothetical protein
VTIPMQTESDPAVSPGCPTIAFARRSDPGSVERPSPRRTPVGLHRKRRAPIRVPPVTDFARKVLAYVVARGRVTAWQLGRRFHWWKDPGMPWEYAIEQLTRAGYVEASPSCARNARAWVATEAGRAVPPLAHGQGHHAFVRLGRSDRGKRRLTYAGKPTRAGRSHAG